MFGGARVEAGVFGVEGVVERVVEVDAGFVELGLEGAVVGGGGREEFGEFVEGAGGFLAFCVWDGVSGGDGEWVLWGKPERGGRTEEADHVVFFYHGLFGFFVVGCV